MTTEAAGQTAASASASPACSDPDGVVMSLYSQVATLAQTPEGRAMLGPLVTTAGGIAQNFAPPQAKIAVIAITGMLNGAVSYWNAQQSQRQIQSDIHVALRPLSPQDRGSVAQQFVDYFRYAIPLVAPVGGICLEDPKFVESPDVKERFERARQDSVKD